MSISNIAEGIGSQAAFKIDASTSLSMTFKRWVNCYIVTFKFNGVKDVENKLKRFSEKQIKSGNKILYPCLSEAFIFCSFVAALLCRLFFANSFEQYCL